MCDLDTYARLTAQGYTVEFAPGSLFDEEGVDGMLWFDRYGDQADYTIGLTEPGELHEIPPTLSGRC